MFFTFAVVLFLAATAESRSRILRSGSVPHQQHTVCPVYIARISQLPDWDTGCNKISILLQIRVIVDMSQSHSRAVVRYHAVSAPLFADEISMVEWKLVVH